MPRQKIDPTKLANLVKEHLDPTQITNKFTKDGTKVTRQGILRAIESLVKSGKINPTEINYGSDRFKKLKTDIKVIDADTALDQWSAILAEAKQAPLLREQVRKLTNQLAATKNALSICESDLKELTQKRQQFIVAQQQGELAHTLKE